VRGEAGEGEPCHGGPDELIHAPIMMPGMEQNLRTPGPTPIPPAVREAQAQPMIDHRGREFAELLHETSDGLAELIGTGGEILLLTGSGSGALEAAVVNTLSPGDRVLSVNIGAFGDRFAKVAKVFGADVTSLPFEWGTAASPDALRDHVAAADPYRAVLVTHNETSTGVANPLRELAEIVRSAPGDPLLLVDGISGLGAMPFEMDAWGVDLVVSASQKAWMASPGIAIAAVGPRARAAEAEARIPRFYWDFAEAREWSAKGQTPWTPAIAVLYGLRVGVARLREEGRERTWARHAAIARAVAAGLESLGLRLVAAPEDRSATVTAAWVPDGLEWSPFNAAMRERGLVIAGGQGKWTGKILRFGHMGDVGIDEMAEALEIMAGVLPGFGFDADGASAARVARDTYEAETTVAVR
jgi:aspartate aminotransferase-like enzyme